MITTDLTGNLGNHMWQYAICRVVAEHNGYNWGFNRTPSHDYHHGAEQMSFMDIDYGQEHNASFGEMPAGVDKLWIEKKETFNQLGEVPFYPFQADIFDIADNTKLVIGCCQNERYIEHKKDDIRKWFKIKEKNVVKYQQELKKKGIILDENLCVINVRGGGEYLSQPAVLLPARYWNDAIAHMMALNPNMKFIVISDDVEYAQQLLPFPVYHFNIGMDYFIVNQAHHLILSNSSFALFPAWLNVNYKKIIAPKYWARHNISFGYWSPSSIYMRGWNYLDREGKLFSYEDICVEEERKGKNIGKVYDAFLFFNELDLLEIRLNTLDPVVDYFILSESTKTHSGLDKPLYYQENKARFKQFEHKIIHQIIDDTPDDYVNLSEDIAKDELQRMVIEKVNRGDWWPHDIPSFGRDTYEKESLLRAMKNCQPDDIIIFSDADEIPNPEIVKAIVQNFNADHIYNLKQKMYFHYLNCLQEDDWTGNTILCFSKFRELSVCELRMRRRGLMVQDGGWHFTFMGDINRVKQKIESYSHQEFNNDAVKMNLEKNIDNLKDIFGRNTTYSIVPIDDSYPKFIVDNPDRFKSYIRKPTNRTPYKLGAIVRLIRKIKRKLFPK